MVQYVVGSLTISAWPARRVIVVPFCASPTRTAFCPVAAPQLARRTQTTQHAAIAAAAQMFHRNNASQSPAWALPGRPPEVQPIHAQLSL